MNLILSGSLNPDCTLGRSKGTAFFRDEGPLVKLRHRLYVTFHKYIFYYFY